MERYPDGPGWKSVSKTGFSISLGAPCTTRSLIAGSKERGPCPRPSGFPAAELPAAPIRAGGVRPLSAQSESWFPASRQARSSILIPFLDWSLQPHLYEPECVPVRDAYRYRLEKFGMGNGVEILGQIGVHHIGVPLVERALQESDRIERALPRR